MKRILTIIITLICTTSICSAEVCKVKKTSKEIINIINNDIRNIEKTVINNNTTIEQYVMEAEEDTPKFYPGVALDVTLYENEYSRVSSYTTHDLETSITSSYAVIEFNLFRWLKRDK